MNFDEKLKLLQDMGVFDSMHRFQNAPANLYATSFDTWTKGGHKACRLCVEFVPGYYLQDDEARTKFIAYVLECLSSMIENSLPDIKLIEETP